MDIVIRNLFCLLRAGTFHSEEHIEPMSASKWAKAYRLSMTHGVAAEAWAGITRLQDQFFMRLTDDLHREWEKSAATTRSSASTPLSSRLSKKIDRMEEEEDSRISAATFNVLRRMATLSQSLLTADRWIRQLLSLAILLNGDGPRLNRELLQDCVEELGMDRMAQMECALLHRLLGTDEKKLPLRQTLSDSLIAQGVEDIAATIDATTHQWQYSQGDNEFVHNDNSSALYWQARHSVHYLKYHPKASINSFFSSFVKSLTNIEE